MPVSSVADSHCRFSFPSLASVTVSPVTWLGSVVSGNPGGIDAVGVPSAGDAFSPSLSEVSTADT